MPRGGPRKPKQGAAYTNRTDLNSRLPVTTVPGQPYGAAKAQADAQAAVPMASPPLPETGPGPQYTTPEDVLGLHHPSQRPDEALTHGLGVGAGAGPEGINTPQAPDPVLKGLAILNSLGGNLSPALKQLAQALQAQQNNRMQT